MISVVVCTYNRAALLREMLGSFYAQDLYETPFELLVVDNASTDDTAEVVQGFAARPGFRPVYEAEQGLSAARNRGIREARGDIIAMLDDDVLVDAQWLRHLARSFAESGADVVGGRSYLVLRGDPPPWFGPDFRGYLSEVDHGPTRRDAGDGRYLFGLNIAFRRSAIEEAGGFDRGLGRRGAQLLCGEERRLCAAIAARGGRLIYEPDAVVGHIVLPERLEWDYFVRLCHGAGVSRAALDAPAGFGVRVLRLAETSAKWLLYAALSLPARLLGVQRYPWRALRCRRVRIEALWGGRWRALVQGADRTDVRQ